MMIWVSNKITRPIQKLHRSAAIIRNGDLEHQIEINTGDGYQIVGRRAKPDWLGELKASVFQLEQKVEERIKSFQRFMT